MTSPFIGTCGYCREEGIVTSIDYIPPKSENELSVWVTLCLKCLKEMVEELEAYEMELKYGGKDV